MPSAVYGNLEYCIAQPQHDGALRRLMRDNPIPGWVTLSYEREPDYFYATTIEGEKHDTMIGIDRDTNRIIGLSTRSVQQRFINGEPRDVGYFGQLRLDPRYRNQIRPLKYGFRFCRNHVHSDGITPYYLTSIISGNTRARQLLTANLPGFPTYREIGTFNTLAIPCKAYKQTLNSNGLSVRRANHEDAGAIVRCLNRNNQRYQFASVWTPQDLQSPTRCRGLSIGDFLIARRGDKVVGCLACWDQSTYKQTVVRGYSKFTRHTRPVINLLSRALGYPSLPAPGREVQQLYVSHLAIDQDDPQVCVDLVKALMDQTSRRGHQLLLLGLSHDNPMLPLVRKTFRHLTYRSQLYVVYWDDGKNAANSLDGRVVHTDIAFL
jgi:hypothetical protein